MAKLLDAPVGAQVTLNGRIFKGNGEIISSDDRYVRVRVPGHNPIRYDAQDVRNGVIRLAGPQANKPDARPEVAANGDVFASVSELVKMHGLTAVLTAVAAVASEDR